MSLVFISTMVISRPDLSALIKGLLVPSIPQGGLTTMLALVGTTIVPYNLFLHSSLVARQRSAINPAELRKLQYDSGLAIGLGGLITLSIVATASAAFFSQQLQGSGAGISAANMARQLEPLLGSMAQYFFAAGLFAAGLTSAITAPLAGAYAVCGMMGWSTALNGREFRTVWAAILLCGAVGASTQISPVMVILFAQATNGVLLPITAMYLLWLMNKKTLLQENRNRWPGNLLALMIILFLLGLSGFKLGSLF